MALIRTASADTEAALAISDNQLMQPLVGTFVLPVDDPLLTSGDLNAWRPVNVRVQDGAAAIDIAGWVTALARQDQTVTVTLNDGAVWLRRRSSVRPSTNAKPAGEHVSDLIALAISGRETRSGTSVTPAATNTRWLIIADAGSGIGTTGYIGIGVASTVLHGASSRSLDVGIQPFFAPSDPSAVRVVIDSYINGGNEVWSNTVQVSADGGSTWGTAHSVQSGTIASFDGRIQTIDVTGDRSWVAADLANVVVRCTVAANHDQPLDDQYYLSPAWWLVDVVIEADFAASADEFPLRMGATDMGGPAITLPDAELKTLEGWLNYLSDQTGYEWGITSDFNQLGRATLIWQPQIGDALDATVTIAGQTRQVAGLDEGGLIGRIGTTTTDATAIYSQVRVTAQGLDDVIETNATLAADIGIHEYVKDLGANATVDDQDNTAATLLAQLASPVMEFSLDVARTPGLWGALDLGTTCWLWLEHAPVDPWQGIIRIVGRTLDDANGTMTISALSVEDGPNSSQPVGAGYQVSANARTRKRVGEWNRVATFKDLLTLARRGAR